MPQIKIIFQGLKINTNLFSPDIGYTNTLVVYDLEYGGKGFASLYARVRHPERMLDPSVMEVEPQLTFQGPFDKAAFQREAKDYYLEFARRDTATPSGPHEEVLVMAVKEVLIDVPVPA